MPDGSSAADVPAYAFAATGAKTCANACANIFAARHGWLAFSLIELMVALAIATIIAVFAVPSYRDHLVRAHIPEATSGLLLTAMRLEQYYQDHRSYANASACGASLPADGQFTFSCTVPADGQSFALTASGRATGSMTGFTYTLDHLGAQRTLALPADWGNSPVNCWIEKRSASC